MCLAIPARIVEIDGENAVVEVNGVKRACNLSFIEDVQIDDFVLLHAGFAIQKWSEEDVLEYNEIVEGMIAATGEQDEH